MHSPMQATLAIVISTLFIVRSGDEIAAELVFDVNADDIVKSLFGGGEAELAAPASH